MTMCFKTHEAKSRHQAEGVNPYISANYITCGSYGIYASPQLMKWSCGEAMWAKDGTQAVSLKIEVYDELLDWAMGDTAYPFSKKYIDESMIGSTNHHCSAVVLPNGALSITDEMIFPGNVDATWRNLWGGPSTLVIFPDDLAAAVIACHDMVSDDQSHSEAWLAMPLEVRQRYRTKDQTEEDTALWNEVASASELRNESRKLAYRERWKVLA